MDFGVGLAGQLRLFVSLDCTMVSSTQRADSRPLSGEGILTSLTRLRIV